MLAKKTQELCGNDVVTVLYFFQDKEKCPTCDDQSFILTYLKKLMGDKLLIFSFNSNVADQEPAIMMVENQYNVTKFPTVIVNSKKLEGLTAKDKVLRDVCDNFKNSYDFCN